MADTPSLGEIVNINPQPSEADYPVIDNRRVIDELNQNARYQAENIWRKYTKFLENKTNLIKDVSAIQEYQTMPEDSEALKEQAADVFKDILNNPSAVLGGRGYDEIIGKISKFKSDAMLSKQNKLDYDSNALFMSRNPELYTEENLALQNNFTRTPLGHRQTFQLGMPAIFDERTAFDAIKKDATYPYAEPVKKDGRPFIEEGFEINPNSILAQWGLIAEGGKDKYGHPVLSTIKNNFNRLPDYEKQKYTEQGGDPIKNYFLDRGQKYIDATFPEGSYDKTPKGNYRFGKKLREDTTYYDADMLKLRQGELRLKWANYGLDKKKLDDADKEDVLGLETTINEAAGIINNGVPVQVWNERVKGIDNVLRVSDPTLLQMFGKVDKDGKVYNVPDALNFNPKNNDVNLLYFGKKGKTGQRYENEIPVNQRTWLKIITKRSFPNKDIGTINSLVEDLLKKNNNSIYDISKKLKGDTEVVPTPQAQPVQQAPKKTAKGLPIFK